MTVFKALSYELSFATKDRTIWLWLALVFCLSAISVGFNLAEVERQNKAIYNLIHADRQDRQAESAKVKDWGSAAYYSFHLTYDQPSRFAFAAMGQRDSQAWKHRIRMLALEGQIYEQDVGNPSTALIGRFDFSFLAACVFPLILIMVLYDLRASERKAGRYNLLEATVKRQGSLWWSRAGLRAGALWLCLMLPLLVVGLSAGAGLKTLFFASVLVFLYTAFWALLCYFLGAWRKSGSLILMVLISIWLLSAVIVPAGARLIIDHLVPIQKGSAILLSQREAVNDAWDLPRETTMKAFFERNPEWSAYQPEQYSFEWQWYYAFQQVGDQKTEPLSKAYRDGRRQRDQLATWASLLAPPALLERGLQALAKTDMQASLAYEQRVRLYHADLRAYYYPKFFGNVPFDRDELNKRPEF